ncbi:MAG TPA: phage tail protein [Actinocrinis sp.]|jgi:phage tail-like protein
MRLGVPGLGTPYTIGSLMPAVYQEDPVAMQWTEALDDVLAPAISALDCIGAYVDPMLAPDDFLFWLAEWFGTVLDENWPLRLQREAVARSAVLYRQAGTLAGMREMLELVTGGAVEVHDSGGTIWSQTPNTIPPGRDEPSLAVRIAAGGERIDPKAIGDLVAAVKPAHVAHTVEVYEP